MNQDQINHKLEKVCLVGFIFSIITFYQQTNILNTEKFNIITFIISSLLLIITFTAYVKSEKIITLLQKLGKTRDIHQFIDDVFSDFSFIITIMITYLIILFSVTHAFFIYFPETNLPYLSIIGMIFPLIIIFYYLYINIREVRANNAKKI